MELDQELLISCATGLGCWKEDGLGNPPFYVKSRDCVECLKDLQRFLRQDDLQKRPAFFALGKRSIAQSDLVPLLTWFPGDAVVAVNAVKVATFLTMPPDPDSEAIHRQIEVMQHVKAAFLTKDALAVVVGLVAEPLSSSANMTEQAAHMVQLVVTFVRNLLCIPDCSATAGARGDHKSRMTNDLLTCLFDNDVMELLLLMAQRTNQGRLRADTPLLVEVFCTIFQGLDARELLHAQPPSDPIAAAGRQPMQARTAVPGLREQFAQEKAMVKVLKLAPRHPRHGGTFVNVHGKQASDVSIVRNVPAKATLPTLRGQKPRTALKPGAVAGRGLQQSLMVRLRQYLDQFLDTSYGLLMGAVRRSLEPGLGLSRLGRDDFLRFLSVARLCTAFVRLKQEDRYREQVKAQKENQAAAAAGGDGGGQQASPFAAISATMGWETFHLVQLLWLQVIDLPPNSKEKDWELQHSSLSLLKEMLVTLDLAKQTGSAADKRAADRLSRRLLHDDQKESGLLPVLSRLLKGFSFKHQPRSHAEDIVEAIHITLRLLERLSKQELGAFLVKRRAPVRRRKAPAAVSPVQPVAAESGSPQVDPQEGGTLGEETPVEKGQAAAKEAAADAAVPRSPVEAAVDGEPKTVADEGSDDGSGPPARAKSRDPFEQIEDEEDLEAQRAKTREVAYNLNQRVRQELAFPAVIHLYTWLLQGYKSNSSFLNHCLVTLLQRIASPAMLNLEPMLYQLSVLRVFEQILSDTAFRGQANAPELLQFCTQVTRNLFARLLPPAEARAAQAPGVAGSSRPAGDHDEVESAPQLQSSSAAVEEAAVQQQVAGMVFLELMFWKNQKEAEDVREEYNWKHIHRPRGQSPERSQSRSPRGRDPGGPALSQAQEQRLRQLFEEHGMEKGYLETIAGKLEEGWPKARVARALKGLGLKRGALTDAQRDKLQKLFEEHRGKRGFLQLIAEAMGGSFRKSQISTHLRKLGLKQSQGKQSAFSSGSHSDSADASGSDGREGQGRSNTKGKRRAKADWSEEESEASQPTRSGSRGQGASGSHGTGLVAGQKPMASDSDEEQSPASSKPPGRGRGSSAASEDQPDAQPGRGDQQDASPSGGSSAEASLPGPAGSEELSPGKAAVSSAGRASGKRRAGAPPQLQAKQKEKLVGTFAPAASPGSGTEHDQADIKAMSKSTSPGHSSLHTAAEDDEPPSGSPMVVPGKRRRLARRAAPIDIDMGTLEDI